MKDGEISAVAHGLNVESAVTVIDGKNQFAFPGVVDSHMHAGIYSHLTEDAITESRAAAMGGLTSSINYMRTGQYYLNKSGPYGRFFPEVLQISDGRFHVDYAYHLAPMMGSHIDEIDWVVSDHACCSKEMKLDRENPNEIFLAKAGFGGTEYLLSGVFSEGTKETSLPDTTRTLFSLILMRHSRCEQRIQNHLKGTPLLKALNSPAG